MHIVGVAGKRLLFKVLLKSLGVRGGVEVLVTLPVEDLRGCLG